MPVYLLATLDTKAAEAAFVRDRLVALGVPTLLVDTGCLGEPAIKADISRDEVFVGAGTSLAEMQRLADRGKAVTAAATGAASIIHDRHAKGDVAGVLGLGGSAGTTIATSAMRALPLGVPKVMVSTLAPGQVRQYVGDKDVFMLNSVVDLAGLNRLSRPILLQAARAMHGLCLHGEPGGVSPRSPATTKDPDKPLIAATMFGVTTPCIMHAKSILEAAGYEVIVFHATGNGGQAMESLIAEGVFAGVLDITTTELSDELVGGILTAGPDRLTAAGKHGIPQVNSVGALDMVNFGPRNTVPEKFRDRQFYEHNPTVTLMRTTVDENRQLGEIIGHKAAAAVGPTAILLPLRGVSAIDHEEQPFDDPAARSALFDGIHTASRGVKLIELDTHINDAEFAAAAANQLLELLAGIP